MEIKTIMLTKNDCYKANKKMTPKGILVHSTGANNTSIARYVQPDDGIIGKNKYDNDWNRSGVSKCVHAFIGKDKNGEIRCYQTLPFDVKSWGCGSGTKGSYNSTHIQFEICEDDLKNKTYFTNAMNMAIEFCAYLCKKYNLKSSTIVSHAEAHDKGYASNHGDCDYWLKKYGKSMKWFREEVEKLLNTKTTATTTTPTTPTTTKTTKYKVVCSALYVRQKPDKTSKALDTVHKGDIITALKTSGTWIYAEKVGTKKVNGWISAGNTNYIVKL